jgi:hypothetical protein
MFKIYDISCLDMLSVNKLLAIGQGWNAYLFQFSLLSHLQDSAKCCVSVTLLL